VKLLKGKRLKSLFAWQFISFIWEIFQIECTELSMLGQVNSSFVWQWKRNSWKVVEDSTWFRPGLNVIASFYVDIV
jgi:hypothetical protein